MTFKTLTTQNIPPSSWSLPVAAWKDWFEHLQINDSFWVRGFWLPVDPLKIWQLSTAWHLSYSGIKNIKSESESYWELHYMFTILFYCFWFPDTIYLVNPEPAHSDTNPRKHRPWLWEPARVSQLITQLMDLRSYRCWLWLLTSTDLTRLVNTDTLGTDLGLIYHCCSCCLLLTDLKCD